MKKDESKTPKVSVIEISSPNRKKQKQNIDTKQNESIKMISFKVNNLTVNIILNNQLINISERSLEQIVEYVDAIDDIYRNR